MRAIVWLWIALVSIQSQANEIQDAETQRLRAEQQLKTLKRDVLSHVYMDLAKLVAYCGRQSSYFL